MWLGSDSAHTHGCRLQRGLSVPQQVPGTGTGRGDIPNGSWAPKHEPSRLSVGIAAALFSGRKGCFREAVASCELRLGSAPGCGSPRAGKAVAFRSDIFQMRCFDFFFFNLILFPTPR